MARIPLLFTTFLFTLAHGNSVDLNDRERRSIEGKKLKIVTLEQIPYVMKNDDGSFQGFIPDLLDALSRNLRFEYELYLVPDGRYGSLNTDTGKWNGMIGEVLEHEKDSTKGADLAAADITITSQRQKYVNFLKPFQHTGLGLLVKKPRLEKPVYPIAFQVLGPFAAEVWVITVAGLIIVSLVLWAINLKNPYEWKSKYEKGRAAESQGVAFNLSGAFWFTFSTLQWQGYQHAPRSIAGRVLSCFWFAFVTITLVTYTGSIMNYLFWASTVQANNMGPPFHTLEGLLMNKEYSYGVIFGGSSHRFITNNKKQAEYQKMADYFNSPEGNKNLLDSQEEGIRMVRNGKFAFIMEDLAARYIANLKPCDLMIAGEKFAPRSYGMAISKQMPVSIANDLHMGILELHEMGEIEALERNWWVDRGECWNVTQEEIQNAAKFQVNRPRQVTIQEFFGPLLLLVIGLVISFLVTIAEIIYYRLRGRHSDNNAILKPEDGNIQG